uniref:Uncharacterized protein n=1 Tax=Avena sativa TaxID=4498 RepID=A0ACD5XYN1_AVESA
MASINGEAPAAAAGNIINPLLLSSARVGCWEALDVLFKREDAQEPPMVIPTQEFLALLVSARGRIAEPADTRDVELGAYRQPASFAAGELLHGVTPGGDTALHAVAGNGDRNDFLKYAGMICGRERGLLFAKNHNGDTPLHCAARAGNSKMVSLLIGLAGREGPRGKLTLLRMENKRHETALHEAVRNGEGRILCPKDREALFDADGIPEERKIGAFVEQQEERTIVKLLMGADPELANYPVDGISPLYLAILLGKSTIALTLYDRSGGNLSYSGADGQNALHVALLRDTAIHGGGFKMSCALLGNPKVNLNLTNNLWETPLDVSRKKVSHGVHYGTNFKFEIWSALYSVGANYGALRWDGNGETHSRLPKSEAEDRESEGLKDTSQNFIVASVLIATMAFTAIFAFPGGFRSADDHTNGGTPTVAGGYIFYAFINAATIAFLCSLVATTGFMLAGSPIAELATRRIYLRRHYATTTFYTVRTVARRLWLELALAAVTLQDFGS